MSELKAETIVPQGTTITLQMYPKSEADKVIAELKAQKARAEDDCAYWKSKAQRERHHKFKRCLAMALLWLERAENSTDLENELVSRRRCSKWMELSEKFKEAK